MLVYLNFCILQFFLVEEDSCVLEKDEAQVLEYLNIYMLLEYLIKEDSGVMKKDEA